MVFDSMLAYVSWLKWGTEWRPTTPNFKTPYTLQELNMAIKKQLKNKITKKGLDDKTWLIGNDHIPNF
jgi:hypothetical protein